MGIHPPRLSAFVAVALLVALVLQALITTSTASVVKMEHPTQTGQSGPPVSILDKRWHKEPPPVLQRPCIVVDKAHGRTYMIGYDAKGTLVFSYIDSDSTCDNNDGGEDQLGWATVPWISLPYPGSGVLHGGRRFQTEQCFLSSDALFMVPTFELNGEGGFSAWDHDARMWSHIRIEKACSCHEESFETGGKGKKVKKDAKRVRFEHVEETNFAVVYQSFRQNQKIREESSLTSESSTATSTSVSSTTVVMEDRRDEAIDSVAIQWTDKNGRDHLTAVQIVNRKVYACHDIKIAHGVLPKNLTLAASPTNPFHYAHSNAPQKYHHQGDHASRCENTTLFFFGHQGSGWFDITIEDKPSKIPFDIVSGHQYEGHGSGKGGFHTLPNLEVEHSTATYHQGQLWIFGKNNQGVGVWSVDTSIQAPYDITARSQGSPTPGSLTCASCGGGIIVYGSCDRTEDCSVNLGPSEHGMTTGNAPVSIYRPGVKGHGDVDVDIDFEIEWPETSHSDEHHSSSSSSEENGSNSGGSDSGSGSGGSSSSESGSSGSFGSSGSNSDGGAGSSGGSEGSSDSSSSSGGSHGSSGESGSSTSGASGSGSGESGSRGGGSDGSSGSSGSSGSGSSSGSSGSGSSSSGSSGASGSGSSGSSGGSGSSSASGSGSGSGSSSGSSGASGSGSSSSGASGSGSGASSGAGSGSSSSGTSGSSGGGAASGQETSGSWSPASSFPGNAVPEGVPGAIVPSYPGQVPPADQGQVLIGVLPNDTLAVPTPAPQATPGITFGGNVPDSARAAGEGGEKDHKTTGAVIGGLFGLVGIIALIALIFVAAKRRRERHDEAESVAMGPGGGPGVAGPIGPEGIIAPGNPAGQPKWSTPAGGGGAIAMPALTPLAGAGGVGQGGAGPSANGGYTDAAGGSGGPSGSPSGAVLAGTAAAAGGVLVAGAIASRHRRKESLATAQHSHSQGQHEQVFGAGHSVHGDSSTESLNGVLNAKRSSKAKFFMGGGDYKPPLRRPSPGPSEQVITAITGGSKQEVTDETLEGIQVIRHDSAEGGHGHGAMIAGGVAIAAGGVAVAHHSHSHESNTHASSSSKTTTTTTTNTSSSGSISKSGTTHIALGSRTDSGVGPGEAKEVLLGSNGSQSHARYESTSTGTGMSLSEGNMSTVMLQGGSISSSSVSTAHGMMTSDKTTILQGGSTTTSGGEHIIGGMVLAGGAAVLAGGAAVLAGGAAAAHHQHGQQRIIVQHQQMPPTIQKTQITLKLSIIRYERSDAAQARPDAKPGTLMFSQVEMIEAGKDVNIPNSAYSHVRDSSKVTGQEDGLPSPVVPGPAGAVASSESEPRERSLRWMKNEFQWKREAGMLQHLRSDLYIAELFTLYALPTFAEYRFVSVMGPFTRTLESYIHERNGTEFTSASEEEGPLSLGEIKSLTDSVASALKWCHDHHVVHLNLSPASVFLQEVYSESDGQGGYRTSMYSSHSASGRTHDGEPPRIERRWKLWNFHHARFVGEVVDLSMDTTPYTAPEILIASRRYHQRQAMSNKGIPAMAENPNKDLSMMSTTTVGADGSGTKTMITKSSSGSAIVANQNGVETEKLMASVTMDMWSLGQIVYEMHTSQAMFTSADDALKKLTSALHKRQKSTASSGSSNSLNLTGAGGLESMAAAPGEDLDDSEEDGSDDDDDDDLDRAKAHDKIRRQLQRQIRKIEEIEEVGAREVITGLLEMQQQRRLDHEEVRMLYLDVESEF